MESLRDAKEMGLVEQEFARAFPGERLGAKVHFVEHHLAILHLRFLFHPIVRPWLFLSTARATRDHLLGIAWKRASYSKTDIFSPFARIFYEA